MNKPASVRTQSKSIVLILLSTIGLISGCSSNPMVDKANKSSKKLKIQSSLLCSDAHSYLNQVVGTGHCVSLIKVCSGAPHTSQWEPGLNVLSLPPGSIKEGSIIATFLNGKYPNKTGWHAAIYISHDKDGIWVWDQWLSQAVHKRFNRSRTDNAAPANSAQEYHLVSFK